MYPADASSSAWTGVCHERDLLLLFKYIFKELVDFFLSASDWEWEKMDVALLFLFHLMIEELRISDRKKLNRVEFIDLSLCSLCLSFSVF